MLLEIACFSLEAAIIAEESGADRIELCSGPLEGGLTPSIAMIALARNILKIPIHVMIRPREGDFLYSTRELNSMEYDIKSIKEAGIEGIVLGILKNDGSIDTQNLKRMVKISDPMNVTFHRAFDLVKDPFQALREIIYTGTSRILTSGQRQTALEGKELIAKLIQSSENKISIMPGSGVNASNIADLANSTSAKELHASVRKLKKGGMTYSNPLVNLHAGSTIQDTGILIPDPVQIRKMKKELKKLMDQSRT
jgi:copper homeostasis protein